jgi:hypothetical protein
VLDDLRESTVQPAMRRGDVLDGLLPGRPLPARDPKRRVWHGRRDVRGVWRRNDLYVGSLRHHRFVQREHLSPGVL